MKGRQSHRLPCYLIYSTRWFLLKGSGSRVFGAKFVLVSTLKALQNSVQGRRFGAPWDNDLIYHPHRGYVEIQRLQR